MCNVYVALCLFLVGDWARIVCVVSQNIVEQIQMFLAASTAHWVVGLHIYTELTEEIQPQVGPQMGRHRRTALTFKESALKEILKTAVQTLQQIHSGALSIPDRQEEGKLLKQVLQLTRNCLAFDFLGTVPDETTDEQSTVMIPHSWTLVREAEMPQLLFELYQSCWTDPTRGQRAEAGRLCLSCLVLVAAFRHSFFGNDEDRAAWLGQMIVGTSQVIRNRVGLENDLCYHEFCRLLNKINTANQLSELCKAESFLDWTRLLFDFTIKSLENWKHLPNSKHYLLGVWSHMVLPLQFLHDRVPPELEALIHQITIAFVTSRLRLAECIAEDDDSDFENPLVHEVLRSEQLEVINQLGRCRFVSTAEQVSEMLLKVRKEREEKLISPAVYAEKVKWFVYIMGALLVGGSTSRQSGVGARERKGSASPETAVSGSMARPVFEIMSEADNSGVTSECLECAFLYFLEQFRKVYIHEQAKIQVDKTATGSFASVMGATDDNAILERLVTKIAFNLQRRCQMEEVVKKSLALLHELVAGFNIVHCEDRSPQLVVSGRLMLKNPTAMLMLHSHASEDFAFKTLKGYGKYRTTFYSTLSKMLFMDIREDAERFGLFMRPFGQLIDELWNASSGGASVISLSAVGCRAPLIGLCRDLRGICSACQTAEHYNMIFSWLVNKPKVPSGSRIHVFAWAAEVWWEDHEVIVPLLKFVAELVFNRSQRIAFDQASANGIVLFKEVAQVLMTYGNRIMAKTSFTDVFRQKYKGIAVALEMFSNSLSGNYVNFGVFEVYKDGALTNALLLALKMCLAIPPDDLQAYIKSLKAYYAFLELATKSFMPQMLELPSASLASITRAIEDGLCSFDHNVSMQCCSAIDNVVSYLFQHKEKSTPEGTMSDKFLREEPQTLRRVLQLMFQLVITGEFSSAWSMSRPMLGLILLFPDEFQSIQSSYGSQHSEEKQVKLRSYFKELMEGVLGDLSPQNKDKFTRNLYHFTQCARTVLF
eukprot:GHVT01089771.1.p1 GENE.GHVT01089771.1~~GHVT01089771.1.p1  ORF type:complete len:993 (-),score=214.78 GHVT01089771.1:221-3199(-)